MSIHYDNLCGWCKGRRFQWAAAWVGASEEYRAEHMPPAPPECPPCVAAEEQRQQALAFQKAAQEDAR